MSKKILCDITHQNIWWVICYPTAFDALFLKSGNSRVVKQVFFTVQKRTTVKILKVICTLLIVQLDNN